MRKCDKGMFYSCFPIRSDRKALQSGMRKSGTLRGFSAAIEFTQITKAYLPIPLYHFEIDHVHELVSIRSKFIVI